MAKTPEKK